MFTKDKSDRTSLKSLAVAFTDLVLFWGKSDWGMVSQQRFGEHECQTKHHVDAGATAGHRELARAGAAEAKHGSSIPEQN
jgi:hypothetical protein